MRGTLTPDQARIRDDLIRHCDQTWDQATAGILAGFRCEYCGIDFLDPTHPDNIHQWIGWDHLVPRSKPGGGDDINNRVCSCWVCNRIKRAWDPRNDERLKGRSNPSRDELIEAAREHIKKAKERYEREKTQRWRAIVGPRPAVSLRASPDWVKVKPPPSAGRD